MIGRLLEAEWDKILNFVAPTIIEKVSIISAKEKSEREVFAHQRTGFTKSHQEADPLRIFTIFHVET